MTKKHRPAPDPELVQMYRQGISSPKIAIIEGIAESTVRYHLGIAFKTDPGLRDEHKAARGAVTRPTAGLRNLNDVVAFFTAEGRLPTTGGNTARERALGAWLYRQRQLSAAGTISPTFREGLSVIPGWDAGPSYQDRHEARWEQRLQELIDYRTAGNEWPRHQKTDDVHERTLGIWLHGQRINHRDGTLTPGRKEKLNELLPGWREGRGHRGGRKTPES
ncbi:Helicase associated domain protein [Pseudarthrobacter sp. AB1]|uniref:helicase associated domain-containing protein n=1 Tax=Pseudarthrobacter sp. AB1 TaxID=2138309 RepID=UPI0028155930|nr:Helicase associated domain protein [Pseudarthrobacter sp. AB1]